MGVVVVVVVHMFICLHFLLHSVSKINDVIVFRICLQCFDAVGWAAGRASSL